MGILAIPTTLSASRLSAISGSGGPLPVRASDEDDRQGVQHVPGLEVNLSFRHTILLFAAEPKPIIDEMHMRGKSGALSAASAKKEQVLRDLPFLHYLSAFISRFRSYIALSARRMTSSKLVSSGGV